jgi:uncharacterized protein (DUF1499 family)
VATYQVEVTKEECDAFDEAFSKQSISQEQHAILVKTCLPTFALGYRAAKKAAESAEAETNEQLAARAKLAECLDYPNSWDTPAYPNVESAAIEALDAANCEAKAFAKVLKSAREKPCNASYTMNDMRDYADGVVTTRLFTVVDSLEQKVRGLRAHASTLHDAGQADNSGAFFLIAAELDRILTDAKNLGRKPFQKRAMYWGKNCFGLTLAMDLRERTHRFGEEAIELLQAYGMTKREVLGAVDYVFGRPIGDKRQEVGGVYTTLAMLCAADGIDMVGEGERDLLEIDNTETTKRIREKRMTKPDFGSGEIEVLSEKQFLGYLHTLSPGLFQTLTYRGGSLQPYGHELYSLFKKKLLS